MWHVPRWSQAVDAIAKAFQVADYTEKGLSRTYSLNGKRDKSNQLLKRIIDTITKDNSRLVTLLNLYFDVIQVGLRELHTLPLTPNKSVHVCRRTFYDCWVMPLLESLNHKLESQSQEALLLREIVLLLKDYYTENPAQSVDGYLNNRISSLLPRGACSSFKQQLYKNRYRRFFSMNDGLLEELKSELALGGLDQQKVEQYSKQLDLMFKSGAVLRSVDKWLGAEAQESIICREQQKQTVEKINQYTNTAHTESHNFHSIFSSEISTFWRLVGHEVIDPKSVLNHPKNMTHSEINRLWPMLLQTEVDYQLRHCADNCYLEEVYAYCLTYAPKQFQQYMNEDAIKSMGSLADLQLMNGVEHKQVEKIHHQIQQSVFLAIKKMLVALHGERQLGHYGVSLASTLISNALSERYRLTENKLTPLLNVMVENLSTDDSLFPIFDFVTPFGLRECGTPGMPIQHAQDIYKDDEAIIYSLALRLHNQRIYKLYGASNELPYLSYPLLKLEQLLDKLFASAVTLNEVTPQTAVMIFRDESIRMRTGEKGNPCWRLSDATPYFILRNLELHLQLIGLIRHNKVFLTPNIDRYYSMSNLEKRRVLKLLDPIAYRRDLKQWWMAKKSRYSSSNSYQVEGEFFLRSNHPRIKR